MNIGCVAYIDSYTPLYSQEQKQLTPMQRHVLKEYFSLYVEEYIKVFRDCASKELQNVRVYIALLATELAPEHFECLIDMFYPIPTHHDNPSIIALATKLRKFFIKFNRLCQDPMEVNHLIYKQAFDRRFTDSQPTPLTKQCLFSKYFNKKIKSHFQNNINLQDFWTNEALALVSEFKPIPEKPAVAKRLY